MADSIPLYKQSIGDISGSKNIHAWGHALKQSYDQKQGT